MSEPGATMAELAPLADEEIVARVLGGDLAAFELLMRRHNQRLYRLARSVTLDDLEAEDVVQETYVRAYANLSRFEGRSSVATWLSRIAFHEALRRRRRRRQAAAMAHALSEHPPAMKREHDAAMTTEDADARALLTEAIEALPERQRAVVMLRLVQGLSTRETAASLRLSEDNVKVILHRARQALGRRLDAPSEDALRELYAFGAERCDRIVAAVFRRLGAAVPE